MANAWMSLVGDSFKCSSCKRNREAFSCPKHEHVDMDVVYKTLADSKLPSSMPDVFKLEQMGICPLVMRSDFALVVSRAYNWWDKGQLGMNFLEAPAWVDVAFNVLAAERSKVFSHKATLKRGS